MAKLYWRVKRDGKWTWVAATDTNTHEDEDVMELVSALRYAGEQQ